MKILRRSGFLVAALLCFSTTAIPQSVNTVFGTVYSEPSTPIPDATITVIEHGNSTESDILGRFSLFLAPGTYTLDIRADGFQSQWLSSLTVPPDLPVVVDIILTPGSPDNKINTVYQRPFTYKNHVGAVHVWTADDMARVPARGPSGLALLSSPFFDDRSGRGIESETTVGLHVMGSGNQEMGYALDGFELNDSFSGNTYFVIPRNSLQQATFFAGSLPAKYGWNSAARASLVSREDHRRLFAFGEASTDGLAGGVGARSFGYDRVNAGIGGPIIRDRLSFFISTQRSVTDDVTPGVFGQPEVVFADTSAPDPAKGFIRSDANGIPVMKKGAAPYGANKQDLNSVFARLNLIANRSLRFDFDYLSTRLERNSFSEEYAFTPFHVPRLERNTWLVGIGGSWIATPAFVLEGRVSYYATDGTKRDRQQTPVEALPGTHLGRFGESTQDGFNLYRSEGRFYTRIEKDASDRLQIRLDSRAVLAENLELQTGIEYRKHTVRFYSGQFSSSGGPLANNPNQFGYYADTTGGKWKLRDAEDYQADLFGFYSSESNDPQFNPLLDGAKHPTYLAFHAQGRWSSSAVYVTLGWRFDNLNTDQRQLLALNDPTGSQDADQLSSYEDLNGNGVQDWVDLNGNGIRDFNEPNERTLGGSLGSEDFKDHERSVTAHSPQAGVSVDLGEVGKMTGNPDFPNLYLWVTYGWHHQVPEFERLYIGTLQLQNSSVSPNANEVIANPNLKLQRTMALDIGLGWEAYPIHVAGAYYRRNTHGLFQVSRIESRPSALTIHRGFYRTITNGFNLTVQTARWNHLSSLLSYDRKKVVGQSSADDGNFENAWLDFETAKVQNPLDFSRKHQLLFRLDFESGNPQRSDQAGVLSFFTGGLQITAGSGFPYTPTVVNPIFLSGTPASRAVAPINSKTGPWQVRIDLKIAATFAAPLLSPTVYLEVFNLLDRKNPVDVYQATGSPYTDGFLSSSSGQANVASDGAVYSSQYLSREMNNAFFQTPRQVILGVVLSY